MSFTVRMSFTVLIPARLGSSRLPDKPLAEIGGLPMVVRVARQAAASGAEQVLVCTDSARIVEACQLHRVQALLTCQHHPSGTDRLAEACRMLELPDHSIVVNVQGDEPLIPPALIRRVAAALVADPACDMATAAHPLSSLAELFDPNLVKVVCDSRGRALLFSRAPIPWSRTAFAALTASAGAAAADGNSAALAAPRSTPLPEGLPALRHVGLYAYRAAYLRLFPDLAQPPLEQHEQLEQLRALHHGSAIAVLQLDTPVPGGVDTLADLHQARAALAAGRSGSGRHGQRAAAEDRP